MGILEGLAGKFKWSPRLYLRKRGKIFAALIATNLISSCYIGDRVLERGSVGNFQVQEVSKNPPTLRLSGYIPDSGVGIRTIATSKSGRLCQVLVHVALATKERPGNLDYKLVIPDDIDAVSFGEENAVIWLRSLGPVPQ